ncbi:hypothetical protein Tco_0947913 [Tanacetum coccineum]
MLYFLEGYLRLAFAAICKNGGVTDDDVILVRETLDDASQWNTPSSLTYDREWHKNQSVVELEYHLEEVFKATNDQLDWHNPEGRPYPHDLSKPLPNKFWLDKNLESGREKSCLRKACYRGELSTGVQNVRKFYRICCNTETSKMSIKETNTYPAVTSLKIRQSFGYSNLKEIIIRRQDDQLYKFREGDFKRLLQQDIEDMLLLLVQGKLTNLNLDERYALNVALRMYTRRIIIQEVGKDL